MTGDVVLERALLAVGRTRALGLHFFGHFIGIDGRLGEGTARMELEGEPAGVGCSDVSVVALAAFVDMALSSAIRSRLAPGVPMVTATLELRHPEHGVAGPLVAESTALMLGDEYGSSLCTFMAGDRPIGQAGGMFTLVPPPPGRTPRLAPWERSERPVVEIPIMASLEPAEAAAVTLARQAGERAAQHNTSVSQELLRVTWAACDPGQAGGTLPIGPDLGNRLGYVQGGILYGVGALAAAQAVGTPGAILRVGHYQFHNPGLGKTLAVEARVLKRGGRVVFAESQLRIDDTVVGVGLYTFSLPKAAS